MTETTLFIVCAIALAGQLGDSYTTEVGLTHGLKEENSVANWIVSKIGVTGITILKCVGFAMAAPVVTYALSHSLPIALTVAGVAAAQGLTATVMNYLTMKKAGISLGL